MEYTGKCYCDTYCNGKGTGNGNGQCKKITVAIFQSGSIIIIGYRNMKQIKMAHSFINKVIDDNYSLKKDEVSFLNLNEKKKVIKLKKPDIINYPNEEQIAKLFTNGNLVSWDTEKYKATVYCKTYKKCYNKDFFY